MYLSDAHKSHPPPPPPLPHQQLPRPNSVDFYEDHSHSHDQQPRVPLEDPDDDDADRDMMIDVVTATTTTNATATTPQSSSHHPSYPHHQIVLIDPSSGGEDQDPNSTTRSGGNGIPSTSSAPKKRAETWVQDETRSLISLRREMDLLFNTSKSNKHLWEQISAKMKEQGFDRSPTMCTDKWRNLLKEFKKAKQQNGGNGSAKMSYYKDIEDILRERNKNSVTAAVALSSASPPFKCETSVLTPSALAKVDPFMQFSDKGIEDAGISFGPIDGDETRSYAGRVISIKWGDYTRRVGIDGNPESIKEAIKSAFGIRTKRAFWLEDEDNIVRSFDRDMPLGNYTLHLDQGVTIKVCHYDESEQLPVHTEEKAFYTEEDFRGFLNRRGWSSVREYDGYRNIDNLDDLRPDGIYRGVT